MKDIIVGHVERGCSKNDQMHYVGFTSQSQNILSKYSICMVNGYGSTKEQAVDNFINNLFALKNELCKYCEQFTTEDGYEIKEMDNYHKLIEMNSD